jgi:CheY-like chemotaxis protein
LNMDVHRLEEGQKAFAFCLEQHPQVLVTELDVRRIDGRTLIHQLKDNVTTLNIPIVVTTKELDQEKRIESLKMGFDDYILKPYYPEEVAARIEMIVQEIEVIEESRRNLDHGFMGNLEEMNLVDLVQTLELGEKSGIIHLNRAQNEGKVFIKKGQIIDAELDGMDPDKALTRMFTWLSGSFWVTLFEYSHRQRILAPNRELLLKATDRIQQWRRISSQLPPLQSVLEAQRLKDIDDLGEEERQVLSLYIEPNTIIQCLESSPIDELKTLHLIRALLEKRYLAKASEGPRLEDPISQIISKHADNGRNKNGQNSYSRITSFFKLREKALSTDNPEGPDKLKSCDIPHKMHLTKGELLLIRQKLRSL